MCSHLSLFLRKRLPRLISLFLNSDTGLMSLTAPRLILVKSHKVPDTRKSVFLLYLSLGHNSSRIPLPGLRRLGKISLLGGSYFRIHDNLVISIWIPLSLHSTWAVGVSTPHPSNPGVRVLFFEPHTRSGTHKMLLIQCLLFEEGRQTTETGLPKA